VSDNSYFTTKKVLKPIELILQQSIVYHVNENA